jgi:hypothetical protein
MMRSVFFPSISDHEIQPIINMVVQESISILDAEIRKTTDSVVIIGLKNAQKLIKEHFKE